MVLVGAEGAGLDADTLALADVAVRIPIDAAVDSLNVVVAAGIALTGCAVSHVIPALPEGRVKRRQTLYDSRSRSRPEAGTRLD